MEITVSRKALLAELQLMRGVAESPNSVPIIGNVLIEAKGDELKLAATDLDVTLRGSCGAVVKAEGAITLSAKKLHDIVKALPDGDFSLKVLPDSWAVLESGRATFKVAGLSVEDFPALPTRPVGGGMALSAQMLLTLIERVSFAITTEDARYYLAGALLLVYEKGLSMVATDGHRLSYAHQRAELGISTPQRILISRKALLELAKLIKGADRHDVVGLLATADTIYFDFDSHRLTCKTVYAQFPSFEKVIATEPKHTVKVGREALSAALKQVTLLAHHATSAVKFILSPGSLVLDSATPDLGQATATIPVEYDGDEISVGFNGGYLLQFLAVAYTDHVTLGLTNAETQGLLRPEDSTGLDHRYVVMPMRL
jgi:DNA polymerase-3 subunit beta